MRRSRVAVLVVVVLVVAAAVPATWWYLQRDARRDKAALRSAAEAFATAWQGGSLDTVSYAGAEAADVAADEAAVTADLTTDDTDLPTSVSVTDVTGPDDGTGSATLDVTWTLTGDETWEYTTTVPLTKQDDAWLVDWSPAVVHPDLTEGLVLQATRTTGDRGRILGADDEVLAETQDVVEVGIQPGRADDPAECAREVAALVDVDADSLVTRVEAAGDDDWVDVITLRESAYQELKAQLQPIPGTVFKTSSRSLAPTSGFALALLGSTGTATADTVEGGDGRVQVGDLTGLSGLQAQYDEQLSGSAGVTVSAVAAEAGSAAAAPEGTEVTVPTDALFSVDPVDGLDLETTIDVDAQEAAESALTAADNPAALVAVRVSTGEVLAVANGGPNATGYNRAMFGQYPPGSTFKVASGYGLLQAGVTPDTTIACPATISVGGRTFKNSEDEVLGDVDFTTDFAHSCNTAFVGSSTKISVDDLHQAALDLGYGSDNATGVDGTFMGSVPTEGDSVEHAADMIGQGQVLASPLSVALASASVGSGTFHSAQLVLGTADAAEDGADDGASATATGSASSTTAEDSALSSGATVRPASSESSSEDAGTASSSASSSASATPTSKELDADAIADLQDLMLAVVTEGTAASMPTVTGDPVHGKTGTAEYGTADADGELPTHAWFTGYQGDVAFAVVVEDGGFGAEVAAPIAASFLNTFNAAS